MPVVREGDRRRAGEGARRFGPRAWGHGGPTNPEPFDVVPIRFTNAFGGPGFAENPVGTGHGGATPPPLVEVRSPLVTSPRDRPPVAGLGRLDPTSPQRTRHMGTHDARWLATRYPGMAEDFDVSYFLLALPDQSREERFDGTEAFSMVNMHPEREEVGGKLPGIVARAFVKKKGEQAMVDVRMTIDTLHFYPHRERAVVVCRGTTRTASDTLADIEEVGFGVEWIDRPKTYEHYMEAFAVKRNRRAGMKRLDDTPLIPEGNPPEGPKERLQAPGEGLRQRQMERNAEHHVAEMRKVLVEHELDASALDKIPTRFDMSVDPDDIRPFDGPPPTMDGIKAQIAEKTEAKLAELRGTLATVEGDAGDMALEQLEKTAATALRGPVGPQTLSRAGTRKPLEDAVSLLIAHEQDASALQAQLDDPRLDKRLGELEAFVRDSYRTMVQHQRAAPALEPGASAALRETVTRMVRSGEPFAYVDLTGADSSRARPARREALPRLHGVGEPRRRRPRRRRPRPRRARARQPRRHGSVEVREAHGREPLRGRARGHRLLGARSHRLLLRGRRF